MSVVGGEASLDWLDLRRPEFAVGFAKTGITTVTRSRSSSTLKTSPSQPLYGPPMTRTLSPDCTLIGITSKKTRLLPISAESHQHSPAIGLTRIRLRDRQVCTRLQTLRVPAAYRGIVPGPACYHHSLFSASWANKLAGDAGG